MARYLFGFNFFFNALNTIFLTISRHFRFFHLIVTFHGMFFACNHSLLIVNARLLINYLLDQYLRMILTAFVVLINTLTIFCFVVLFFNVVQGECGGDQMYNEEKFGQISKSLEQRDQNTSGTTYSQDTIRLSICG